jgi:serine/threonine protein kinase
MSDAKRKHQQGEDRKSHKKRSKKQYNSTITGGVFGRCASVERFGTLDCIGKGTYGTVYRAVDRTEKKAYALKRVILHNEKSDGFPLTSVREIRILKLLSHPNIVQLHDVIVGKGRDDVFLTFEYCEHDMSTLLQSFRSGGGGGGSSSRGSRGSSSSIYQCKFGEGGVKRLMLGLLSGLQHLHERLIVHRDLKMSNLLYNSRGVIKIADFGMARFIPQPVAHAKLSPKVMTLWYRAPEMLLGRKPLIDCCCGPASWDLTLFCFFFPSLFFHIHLHCRQVQRLTEFLWTFGRWDVSLLNCGLENHCFVATMICNS